jgi:hypothetical protein
MKRARIALLGVLLPACASHAPLALHGDIAFPRPDAEACDAQLGGTSRLSVSVADPAGFAFPGVALYVVSMGDSSAEVARAHTNEQGVASFDLRAPDVYVVTAVLHSFSPEVRALTLRAGCTGSTSMVLKVGPMQVER